VALQTLDEIADLLESSRAEDVPAGPYVRAPAPAYTQMTHDVLRQTHAHEAAERPDAAARYEYGATSFYLWTRRAPDGAPWVALVTSVSPTERGIVLNAGYRVPADSPEEAAALAADPSRTLATLVTRYGVTYYSGTQRVFFLPQLLVNLPAPLESLGPEAFSKAVSLQTPPDGAQVAVNVASYRGRDGSTRLSWLFVLDLARYEREAKARRR
jgi:hypothetical protein